MIRIVTYWSIWILTAIFLIIFKFFYTLLKCHVTLIKHYNITAIEFTIDSSRHFYKSFTLVIRKLKYSFKWRQNNVHTQMDIGILYGMYVLYGPTKISCPFQFIVSCLAFTMSCNLYLSQERIFILRYWYFLMKLVSCIILFVALRLERLIFILFRLNLT